MVYLDESVKNTAFKIVREYERTKDSVTTQHRIACFLKLQSPNQFSYDEFFEIAGEFLEQSNGFWFGSNSLYNTLTEQPDDDCLSKEDIFVTSENK